MELPLIFGEMSYIGISAEPMAFLPASDAEAVMLTDEAGIVLVDETGTILE